MEHRSRWIRSALLASLLVAVVAAALQTASAPAAPGVYSFDRLRLAGPAGVETYVYTAGNVVYPEGGVDTGRFYRFVVADSAGVTRNSPVCRPESEFATANNAYTIGAGDPLSTSASWKYTLQQHTTANCSGTPSRTTTKNFYVASATAYADSALTIPRSIFRPGETAFVVARGVKPSSNNWSGSWILPSGSIACANTAGNDRPDSSAGGVLPSTFLQYRPNTTSSGSNWNRESTYETRPCANFAGGNEGAWKLRLQFNATNLVDVPVFSVDATGPPVPTIDSGPPNPSGAPTASFTFSDAESGTSFACRLDGATFAVCTSPASYSGLTDGAHTFQVKARDAVGNESAAASYAWTVDSGPPPAPTISPRPPDPSNSPTATFGFAGEAGAEFYCQLDGSAFSECGSPVGYQSLSEGTHSFAVKARDALGHEGPAASYSWTIDLTPPAAPSVDSHPPDPTNSPDATFVFSGEAGASFHCRLDQGAFGSCTSPAVYSGLQDGTHSFEVKARDAAGNESAAASYSWLISAPPVVTLAQPVQGSTTNDPTPSFAGQAGTEVGDDPHVTVKVYAGSVAEGSPVQTLVALADFTGAYTIEAGTALLEGTYTARAEQSDAGGTGYSSANTFVIDTTPPAPPAIGTHPPALSNSRSAAFGFSGDAGATFRCRLDGAAFAACTSPTNYSSLIDGAHSFDVKARDVAGNESAATTFGWTIDATAPAITLTSPANGSSSDNPRPTFGGVAGIAVGDGTSVVVRVYSGGDVGGTLLQTLTTTAQSGGAYSAAASSDLPEGTYTARSEQQDAAGNLGLSGANTFVVGTSYRGEVLADSPRSYWRLGETSGSAAADAVGVNAGTYTGGVTLGQPGAILGDSNGAASFDGVDDFVLVPDAASLDFTTAITVELWVKRTKNAAYQVVFGKPGNGQSRLENYALWFNTSNGITAYFGNGTTFVSVASAAFDTNWHHVVASYDNATARLYVDGALRGSASSTVQLTANALPLNMGRAQGVTSYFFGGALDEVAVYPAALPLGRIQAHYDAARRVDSRPPDVTLTSPAHGSSMRLATPTLAGVAGSQVGDNPTVTVKVYSGPSPTGTPVRTMTTTRQPNATFSVDVSPALAVGTYTAQAEQSDTVGNVGRSSANTFSIDTTAPTPTLAAPAHGSVKNPPGTFAGQGGTAAGDASSVTVRVYAGSDTSGQLVRTLPAPLSGGSFSVDSTPPLGNGTYTAQVEQLDLAGNLGLSSANTFTVTDTDVTPPSVTLTQPSPGTRTSETTPLLGGVGGTAFGDSTSVTVKVYAGGAPVGTPVQTLSASRDFFGAYSVRAAALGDGTYTAQAEQLDDAGNLGRSLAVTFAIDTVGPVIVLTTPANGSSNGNARPAFSGTAGIAAGDASAVTVKVWTGPTPTGTPGQVLTTTAGSGGTYSVLANPALQAGVYTARAEQSDVAGNTGQSSANTFTITASTSAVVLAAGDIAACGSDTGADKTAAILDQYPNATVTPVGDTAYDHGQPSDFACGYDRNWGRSKARTLPMIGDHEYDVVAGGTPPGAGYFQYFHDQLAPYGAAAIDPARGYYSYDIATWHVVVLNGACYFQVAPNCNTELQEQWFENDLNANPTDCTLVFWHQPRFSSGNIHGDYVPTQQFWATSYEHGVELVLSGDDHVYERFARMDAAGNANSQYGVRQFVVGTGGYSHYGFGTIKPNSQVRNSDTFGVLKLSLRASDFDWQFLPEAGHTFTDSGTDTCHPEPPPPPPGAPEVRSTSSSSANHPATSIAIAKPAGAAQGDLLVAVVAHQSGAATNMTPPAGWTAVPNTDYSDGNNARIHSWYKLAGAGEPSSYTFTLVGSGQAIAGGILAVTGASATPINASLGQVTSTNSLYLTAPSITTTAAKSLLVYGGTVNQPLTMTAPAFMRERFDAGTTGEYNIRTEVATQALASTGPTGVRTGYVSGSGARGAAILIAIAPSSP